MHVTDLTSGVCCSGHSRALECISYEAYTEASDGKIQRSTSYKCIWSWNCHHARDRSPPCPEGWKSHNCSMLSGSPRECSYPANIHVRFDTGSCICNVRSMLCFIGSGQWISKIAGDKSSPAEHILDTISLLVYSLHHLLGNSNQTYIKALPCLPFACLGLHLCRVLIKLCALQMALTWGSYTGGAQGPDMATGSSLHWRLESNCCHQSDMALWHLARGRGRDH